MQSRLTSRPLTHRCYALALTDGFTFLNQQRRVVPICTEVSVVVLDDNKLSIADQSTTGIDHPPSGRCLDRLPRLDRGGRERTVRSMFVFGVSYAIASIGCTLPLFLGPVAGTFSRDSYLDGVLVFAAYGLGMALVLLALTVGIALARTSIVRGLRSVQPYIGRVAGGLVALAGAYVAYYGWLEVRMAREGAVPDSNVTDVVAGWSRDATQWITDIGAVRIAVVVTILVVGVVVAVRYGRTRTPGGSTGPGGPAAPGGSTAPGRTVTPG